MSATCLHFLGRAMFSLFSFAQLSEKVWAIRALVKEKERGRRRIFCGPGGKEVFPVCVV